VAPYDKRQWLALDLCHQIPGFWRFLYDENSLKRYGYVAACFSGFMSLGNTSRAARYDFGKALISDKRKDILSRLFGRDFSKSEVRVIERLAPDISRTDVINALDALELDAPGNALRQADYISKEFLYAVEVIDLKFVHANISDLISDGFSVEKIRRCIELATENLTSEQINQSVKPFSKTKTIAELET
jgi:hypothetical protein